MNLFGTSDDGCTAHHYETVRELKEWKVEKLRGANYAIYQKVKEKCQHEGCDEERERWERINHVSNGVDSGCNRRFREKLRDVIEY